MQFEISLSEDISCGRCIARPPSFDFARSLLKFDKNSKQLIHAFKYHDKIELAKFFSQLLYKTYHNQIGNIDYIIPVPMHRIKRLLRMYNQADSIATRAGKLRVPDLLIKTKWTKSQVYLSKRARKENLRNTIKLNPKYDVKGKVILIIDDVVTTGIYFRLM